MKQIAFIGLGHMGAPMATNLLKAGYLLNVFDLAQSAVDGLVVAGASAARSARDAGAGRRRGHQHAAGQPARRRPVPRRRWPARASSPPAPWCWNARPSPRPRRARVHAAARERGLAMLDAPVSGGTAGAVAGTLTFMVGGDAEALEKARPLFEAMGRNIFHAGPDGAGQVATGVQQPAPRGADDRYRRSHGPGCGQRPRGEGAGRDHAPQLRRQLGAGSLQPLAGVMENAPASRDYSGGFMAQLMAKDLGLAQEAPRPAPAARRWAAWR